MVYHVASNLETSFNGISEALSYFNNELIPRVPINKALGENSDIPRICVCKRIEDCFTAIGLLGTFRRCLGANEDAYSYGGKGIEVYPVIVLQFKDKYSSKPPDDSVPDMDITNELWIRETVRPEVIELKWLNWSSIIWEDCVTHYGYKCKSVKFIEPTPYSIHPWINGRGNILDSSNPEEV